MKTTAKNRILRALSPPGLVARLAIMVMVAGVLSAACDSSVTAPDTLASITVSPNASLEANATQQFVAVGKNAAGAVVVISPTWSVVAGGGDIDNAGLFTAGTVPGAFTGTVMASSGGISGTASVTVLAPPPPLVDLGAAATHGALAGSTVVCTEQGSIQADVSVWPGGAITGFPPCTITGARHAADAYAQAAQEALTTAFSQLDAMACGTTLDADLGGQTLQPGVYCSPSSQLLLGEMIFDAMGDPNASLVIKAATTLTTMAAQVTLRNGAQARNIYWLVGTYADLGYYSDMKGNILAGMTITLQNDSFLVGRALARDGAVSLWEYNSITMLGKMLARDGVAPRQARNAITLP
jgi:hypothetical protein